MVGFLLRMPCLFQLLTGLYCPGCGGTRALRYLLKGQIGKSIQYHPLVLYLVVVMGLEVGTAMLAKMTGNARWYLGYEKQFVWGGVVLVVINWILKNYVLLVKGIDLLPMGL